MSNGYWPSGGNMSLRKTNTRPTPFSPFVVVALCGRGASNPQGSAHWFPLGAQRPHWPGVVARHGSPHYDWPRSRASRESSRAIGQKSLATGCNDAWLVVVPVSWAWNIHRLVYRHRKWTLTRAISGSLSLPTAYNRRKHLKIRVFIRRSSARKWDDIS